MNEETKTNQCPCGLTQEILERYNKLDDDLNCTAEYADKSRKICGKPLGDHPREQQFQQQSQSKYIHY